MLAARFYMNSGIEDVLAFKCCNMADQNLEIHVENLGTETVFVAPRMILSGGGQEYVVNNLYPPGGWTLAPGETGAFYVSLDPDLWDRYHTVELTDGRGARHCFSIVKGA
ncbi:MAG: hypothetical protein ABIM40_15520 [Pseudomonadota bacterium]